MEIGSVAAQFAQSVASSKAALGSSGAPAASASPGFGGALDSALKSVSAGQQQAESLQQQFQLENPNVSLEETMIALNKSQISFQAAVQVRNKLVQAYESVMNMSV